MDQWIVGLLLIVCVFAEGETKKEEEGWSFATKLVVWICILVGVGGVAFYIDKKNNF